MRILVVLGNRLNDDGSITDIMRSRLELALKINKKIAPEKIILSGGIANKKAGFSEAEQMRRFLTANGIDSAKLILEDKSLSTKQNAKFSVPIAVDRGATEILLCTSAEHMHRKFLNPQKLFAAELKKYPNVRLSTFCDTDELL